MERVAIFLLLAACSSSTVMPPPAPTTVATPIATVAVPDASSPAPDVEAPETACPLPCVELAAGTFDDAPLLYDSGCDYPRPEVGRCEDYVALAACVRQVSSEGVLPKWVWNELSTMDERRNSPGPVETPTEEKRARMRRNQAANAAVLDRLAHECATKAHPTAGLATLDVAARKVTFGSRSFGFPARVDLSEARIVDLGTERIVVVPPKEDLDVGHRWTEYRSQVFAVRKDALVSLGKVLIAGEGSWSNPGDGALYQTVEHDDLRGYRQTVRFGAKRVTVTEQEIEDYTCADCTACPYVFVERAGAFVEAGEVLRNMVGVAAEHTDDLAIEVDGPVVTLELRELKPETSYVDALWLEVDGVRIDARACGSACADDARYEVLEQGDVRRFEFDVPAGTTRATVVANGYYLRR